MSITTKSILAAAALLCAWGLLAGATGERLNIRSPDSNCPLITLPGSETACLDDDTFPRPARKKVYFAAAAFRPTP